MPCGYCATARSIVRYCWKPSHPCNRPFRHLSQLLYKSTFKLARSLFGRKPWTPLGFPTFDFEIVKDNVLLEEEQLDDFEKGACYPVNIGEIFASKYRVVGKLGFGTTLTVWLARDMQYAKTILDVLLTC
jgi:hypothetical protein